MRNAEPDLIRRKYLKDSGVTPLSLFLTNGRIIFRVRIFEAPDILEG